MELPDSWIEVLDNHKIGRKEASEILGIAEEDVRAFRRILKIENKPKGHIQGKGIALWDIHYPEHDKPCINIVYDFTKDLQPDYFILGGDQLDMSCISIYNKGKPKLLENKRLKRDYQNFQKNILDRFEAILPDKCKKVFMIGNHEYRVTRLIESDPQYEGFIEVENNLDLSDWEIIPYNGIYSIGYMNFIHGYYTNKYHSSKTLSVYGDNIFYGHTHNHQAFTSTTKIENLPKIGMGVGCLCNKNPDWMHNKPNSWVHEFLHFTVFSDGTFSPHINRIINGRCEINGKIYVG